MKTGTTDKWWLFACTILLSNYCIASSGTPPTDDNSLIGSVGCTFCTVHKSRSNRWLVASQYTFCWQAVRISLRVWVRYLVDHNVPFDNNTPIYLINLTWKLGLDLKLHYFSIIYGEWRKRAPFLLRLSRKVTWKKNVTIRSTAKLILTCTHTCRCRAKSSLWTFVAPLTIQTILEGIHRTCKWPHCQVARSSDVRLSDWKSSFVDPGDIL